MFKGTALLFVVVLVCSSLVIAQTAQPEVGYAVVTPQGGNLANFTGVETLFSATDIGVARADAPSAPILTNAALSVSIGGVAESGTVLVIVNASPNTATVNFSLTNAFGVEISNRTISIPDGAQISQSVNSLLQSDLVAVSSGLLRITSNIPVAILALEFRGVGFTSVPITNLAVPPLVPPVTTTPAAVVPAQATPIGVAPIGVPPAIIGVAPTVTGVIQTSTGVCVVPPLTNPVTPPMTVSQPQLSVTTGSTGAFVFPQVVTGGGGATSITVGNISTIPQAVRFDSFSSAGNLIRTISNVLIPSGGLVVFSSESGGIVLLQQ